MNLQKGSIVAPKRYEAPEDLFRCQAALMEWVREAGHCHLLHKGDIGHRLFNGGYGYDPGDLLRFWLDENGEIAAFALLSPHWEMFELQLAPRLWHSDGHAALMTYCEEEMLRLAARYRISLKAIAVEAESCDPAHTDFIQARGYTFGKHSFTWTRHNLERFPAAELPAGFRFHKATAADAERLADVHNHSFSNKWNAESYGAVFGAPHMEYEFVVLAPDGRFAAFTNVWIDEVNRSLLFEPVGTHEDFRLMGIGKALMVAVMKRMRKERGIRCAYVCHAPPDKNPASGALYASVGFEKLQDIYDFKKSLA